MTRALLSGLARSDLDSIWDYGVETWGPDRAEAYVRQLQRVIEATAVNPKLGRSCDNIRPGYFRRTAGTHIIFYRLSVESIEVVRILHQRMDFDRHL